jgi:hypothetical protein
MRHKLLTCFSLLLLTGCSNRPAANLIDDTAAPQTTESAQPTQPESTQPASTTASQLRPAPQRPWQPPLLQLQPTTPCLPTPNPLVPWCMRTPIQALEYWPYLLTRRSETGALTASTSRKTHCGTTWPMRRRSSPAPISTQPRSQHGSIPTAHSLSHCQRSLLRTAKQAFGHGQAPHTLVALKLVELSTSKWPGGRQHVLGE